MPDLPTDPISFDDENWGQELEEFENADESWNGGDENDHSVSNHSSVTLSSRGSKRNYDEYESGGERYDEEEDQQWELPGSPGIFFLQSQVSQSYMDDRPKTYADSVICGLQSS